MAVTLVPGQIVGQGDWDALFKQHGGMSNDTPSTRRGRTEAEIKAAALAGDQDAGASQRPIYQYVLVDGSVVAARTSADGEGYEVVEYKPSQAFTQAQPSSTANPATQKPAGGREGIEGTQRPDGTFDNTAPVWVVRGKDGAVAWTRPLEPAERAQWERERNAGLAQDPRSETDADRAARGDATRKQQGADARQDRPTSVRDPVQGRPGVTAVKTTDPATGRTETHYEDDSGARVATPTETPKPVAAPDGTYGYWDTTGPQARWVPIQGGPAPERKPQSINGQFGYWKPSADGAPEWVPVEGPRRPALPEGMPALDTSSAEAAHTSYLDIFRWGVEQARAHPDQVDQIKATLAPVQDMAESVIKESQRGITNAQNARSQDLTARGQDVQDVNARRSLGTNVLQNAFTAGHAGAMKMLPGNGETAMKGMLAMIAIQDQYIKANGLMSPLPPNAAASAGLLQPGAGAAPGGPPVPAASSLGQAQNALGLGAIGAVPAPGGPAPGAPAPGGPPPLPAGWGTNTTEASGAPREYTPAQSQPPAPQGVVINVGAQPTVNAQPQGTPASSGLLQQARQGPPPLQDVLSRWDPNADGLLDDLKQTTGMRDDDLMPAIQGLGSM
jgi:hypothetical protein